MILNHIPPQPLTNPSPNYVLLFFILHYILPIYVQWFEHLRAEMAGYRAMAARHTPPAQSPAHNQSSSALPSAPGSAPVPVPVPVSFNDSQYHAEFFPQQWPWTQRLSKAVFAGNLHPHRQLVVDLALARPDLLDVTWTCPYCR